MYRIVTGVTSDVGVPSTYLVSLVITTIMWWKFHFALIRILVKQSFMNMPRHQQPLYWCSYWIFQLQRMNILSVLCAVQCSLTHLGPRNAYMRLWTIPPLVQIMACQLFGAKPLSKSIMAYCQLDLMEHISMKYYLKFKSFHSRKGIWKDRL